MKSPVTHLAIIALFFTVNHNAGAATVCAFKSNSFSFRSKVMTIKIRRDGVEAGEERLMTCAQGLARVQESGCSVDPESLRDLLSLKNGFEQEGSTRNMYGAGAIYLADARKCAELIELAKSGQRRLVRYEQIVEESAEDTGAAI